MGPIDGKKPLCVLVGSGVSRSAGMPSVDELTHRIEYETEVYRHGQGDYHLGRATSGCLPKNQYRLCEARTLFQSLRLRAADYFQKQMARQPNYEDIYYLNEQLYSELFGDTENPLVANWLYDQIVAKTLAPLSRERSDNLDVILECRNLIRDVVWKSLVERPTNINYLDRLFGPLMQSNALHVFSLNHDCVIETYFEERKLDYSVGFGCSEQGVRYWNPSTFDPAHHQALLYKLHGSVNWFYLRPRSSPLETERVGIPLDGDSRHTVAPDGRRQYPVNPRPVLLVGTFNKITDYTDDLFIELHHRFLSCLSKSQVLIVCGYGFGDKGINGRVLSWLLARPDRRMIVIDKEPQMRDRARGAVRREWDNLCSLGRIQVVASWIEDLDPGALTRLIA